MLKYTEMAEARNMGNVKRNSLAIAIDENGEPLIVYYGTESGGHYKFNADEYARAEKVTWFVDNEKVAYEYARNWESEQFDKEEGSQIYSCFLNIKNPVVIEANGKDYNSMEGEIYKATLDKNQDGVKNNSCLMSTEVARGEICRTSETVIIGKIFSGSPRFFQNLAMTSIYSEQGYNRHCER